VEVTAPLASGPEGVRRLARGDADFCVTGAYYFLAAGPVAARFVLTLAQRSPMAAMVRADSDLRAPADLAGRRVAVGKLPWIVAEYEAALDLLGVGPPERVAVDPTATHRALGRGEIDVSPAWADALHVVGRRGDVDVRAIPVGPEVYTTGVVAADHVPDDVVGRMHAAVVAALEDQRRDPARGLDELARRYPDIDPGDALDGWRLLEPYAFAPPGPATMDPERWRRTVELAVATHGLPPRPPGAVFRLTPAVVF